MIGGEGEREREESYASYITYLTNWVTCTFLLTKIITYTIIIYMTANTQKGIHPYNSAVHCTGMYVNVLYSMYTVSCTDHLLPGEWLLLQQ